PGELHRLLDGVQTGIQLLLVVERSPQGKCQRGDLQISLREVVEQLPTCGLAEIARLELLPGIELQSTGPRLLRQPDRFPQGAFQSYGRNGKAQAEHVELWESGR